MREQAELGWMVWVSKMECGILKPFDYIINSYLSSACFIAGTVLSTLHMCLFSLMESDELGTKL